MALEERVTLECLHNYAKEYFPDAFAKLAPVGEFQFKKHGWKPTKTQEQMNVVPMKCFLGHNKFDPTKFLWAFLCTKTYWIYTMWENERCLRMHQSLLDVELSSRLGHAFGDRKSIHNRWMRNEDRVKILVRYYFLAGKVVSYLFRTDHDLFLFEAGCKSGIHWNNIFELSSLDKIAEGRFKMISTSMQSSPLAPTSEIAQEM